MKGEDRDAQTCHGLGAFAHQKLLLEVIVYLSSRYINFK